MSNTAGDAFADKFPSKADVFSVGSSSQHPGAQGAVLTLHHSTCVACMVCLVLTRSLQGSAWAVFISVASAGRPQGKFVETTND